MTFTPGCELCRFTGPFEPVFPRLDIVRCPSCRLTFYTGQADPAALYDRHYFMEGEYGDYVQDRRVLELNFQPRIQELKRLRPQGRLLEIGSAYGFFLNLARKQWEVSGFEISREAVDYARKELHLAVQDQDFLSVPDQPESCDVIGLWDTIEHLPHPVRVLEKAARWLKPGGVLALTTGDIDSVVARWRGEKWRLIHPPTHLFYFSQETLRRAVEQSGLVVKQISYPGLNRSWRSILYALFMHQRSWPIVFRVLTVGERINFPIYLNLFDIVCLVAIKPQYSER